MFKPIPRQVHGAVDSLYAATAAAAPEAFGFRDEQTAARLIRFAAGGVVAYSLLTRYEWGVVRVLPWRSHLAADVIAGAATAAAPWLFGFAYHRAARNTFVAMGLFSVAAGLLTETDEPTAGYMHVGWAERPSGTLGPPYEDRRRAPRRRPTG